MNRAIIALGSNIDPQENIQKAKELIQKKYHAIAESTFIPTKPLGYTEQNDFINGSMLIETDKEREALKAELKKLETQLGRKVSIQKAGPRTIDLDIIVWNGEIIDKDFYQRDFLKKAALELIPTLKY